MKKIVSLACVLALLVQLVVLVPVQAAEDSLNFIIRPDSFSTNGDWTSYTADEAVGNYGLCGPTSGEAVLSENVAGSFQVPNGTYYIWVRSVDYPEYSPGTRLFSIKAEGTEMGPADGEYFGAHGVGKGTNSGDTKIVIYWWEKAAMPVEVTDGTLNLEVCAKTNFARFDMIYITSDPSNAPGNAMVEGSGSSAKYAYDFTPPKVASAARVQLMYETLKETAQILNDYYYKDELTFPSYAQQKGETLQTASLDNGDVSVDFRLESQGGQQYVQRNTKVNGQSVDRFEDGMGFLCMYGENSGELGTESTPILSAEVDGNVLSNQNVFKVGYPSWILLSTLETQEDGSIKMTGENDYASVTAVWTLADGDLEPKVDVSFTVKKTGSYSFGMFYSPEEIPREETKFIQVPFRYQEQRIPEFPVILTEAFSTTALTQVTTDTDYVLPGKDVTYGLMVDPSALQYRWVYSKEKYEVQTSDGTVYQSSDKSYEQSDYGLGIVGMDSGVQPGIFSPVMGAYDSRMTEGTVYRYAYRPMATVSEPALGSWYDAYSHAVEDVLKVTDYRNNYYDSMTNTIFNFYDLLLDDYYSGWDDRGKGHYNMEGRNIVTVSDPLVYMQMYLLTEDQELYEKRTLPTMEYILSRKGQHFAYGIIDEGSGLSGDPYGSTYYFYDIFSDLMDGEGKGFGPLGQPEGYGTASMGNSVYAGAYLMTMGQVPYFRSVAVNELKNTHIAQGNGAALENPSELLWMAKLDKGDTLMNRAVSAADRYVAERVNDPHQTVVPDENFIYIDFYPQFHTLLEMYEETGDETYLDAAQESARRLLTTLWSAPMHDPEGMQEIDGEEVMEFAMQRRGATLYWHGDRRLRIGLEEMLTANNGYIVTGFTDDALVQQDETVPQWVPSRVGLGIEQTSTFKGYNSNIIMSTWAPDLIRLAELTGEELFETYARNAIVGRYENYPGYYHNNLDTYSYRKDFPYKGPELTNIYYHHIPVLMGALQDFLFSQAYNWSDQQIDFPTVRNQGYAWFNNRHYGFAPGKVFAEEDMWLWLKRGLVETGNKQIDWFGARKDGRCAFVFMNACDDTIPFTASFGDEVGVQNASATVYYPDGSSQTAAVTDGEISLTLAGKGLVAVAFDAPVQAPGYQKAYDSFDDYGGRETILGETHTYDDILPNSSSIHQVNGYILQMDPDMYDAYVYTTFRPQEYVYEKDGQTQTLTVDEAGGINRATLYYKLTGDTQWTQVVDMEYPFEFTVNVSDPDKKFEYYVEVENNSGTYRMEESLTMSTDKQLKVDEKDQIVPSRTNAGVLCGQYYLPEGNPGIDNGKRVNHCTLENAGNYFIFAYYENKTDQIKIPTFVYALYDAQGRFIRIAQTVSKAVAPGVGPVRIDTEVSNPIVISEEEKGCHVVIYALSGMDDSSLRPLGPKFDTALDMGKY